MSFIILLIPDAPSRKILFIGRSLKLYTADAMSPN
jgi:hypothetical protein